MTDTETLTKAIALVIKGGWSFGNMKWQVESPTESTLEIDVGGRRFAVEELIYLHEFAKCLFGLEPLICSQCERTHHSSSDCDCGGWPFSAIKQWQYHLQQMVISPDPIAYLREHMGDE